MKRALIVAHPRIRSFTMTMAEAYAQAARHEGVEVVLRDLYRLGFDPLLHMEELPDHEGFQPRADVRGAGAGRLGRETAWRRR